MLPLLGSVFPASAPDLQQALSAGFSHLGLQPRGVTAEGGSWPEVQRLAVDLSGAALSRHTPQAKPGSAQAGVVQAQELSLQAKPLLLEEIPVQFELHGRGVILREHSSERVPRLLLPERAALGHLSLEIQRLDLQRLALAIAQEAAKGHGAQIQDLTLELTATGGRTVAVKSDVTAKFGFVKATLHLTGTATLDDALQLHLSDLDVKGSGLASGLATAFIRPQLTKISQQPISLKALPLGEIKLRDVRLTTGETVRVEAEFGD